MSTDDVLEVLRILRSDAEAAEPAASALVRRAAEAAEGEVARFETRFKTDASIVAKLERFARKRPPRYRLHKFNDALRYTIVITDESYWTGCLAAIEVVEGDGLEFINKRLGWRHDYAGMNLTAKDAHGRIYEIQLHTATSLAAAEETHPHYVEWRSMDPTSAAARFIRRGLDAAAARVPLPPGVPRL